MVLIVLKLASWRVKMLQFGHKWVWRESTLKIGKKRECAEKRARAHVTQKINKTRKNRPVADSESGYNFTLLNNTGEM